MLISRTTGGLEEIDDQVKARGAHAVLVPLDLKDGAAIDRLGPALSQRFDRVDVFIGNAAVLGSLRPLTHYTPELWREAFDVNVDANWRLLRTLEPLLRRSEAGRVILVTSRITQSFRPYWGLYAATKAALEGMARCYANELKQTKITVNLVDPPATATRMRAEAFPGEDPASIAQPDAITETFVRLAEASSTVSGERFSADPS